jgi:hypothetical protein
MHSTGDITILSHGFDVLLQIDEAMLNIYGPPGHTLWTANAKCDTCALRRVCEIVGGHMKLVMNATFKTVWETRFADNSVNCSRFDCG